MSKKLATDRQAQKRLWLLKYPKALESIHRGMEEAKKMRLTKLDSKEFNV